MDECLNAELISEKRDFLGFLKNDKKFRMEAESYGMNLENLILENTSIKNIFQIINIYSEWETHLYIIQKMHECYLNFYSYFAKKTFNAIVPLPPKDFDYHDSDPKHY
jgi:hypothetical protein